MSKVQFSGLVDEVIKLKMDVVDEYVDRVIAEIGDIGSPEKLIGKKYEDWTPEDLQRLGDVYGPGDDTPLGKLIFRKEYDKVLALEAEA